jgi:hypothetical protein
MYSLKFCQLVINVTEVEIFVELKIAFSCTIVWEEQFSNIWILLSWLTVLVCYDAFFLLLGRKIVIQIE